MQSKRECVKECVLGGGGGGKKGETHRGNEGEVAIPSETRNMRAPKKCEKKSSDPTFPTLLESLSLSRTRTQRLRR